MGPSGSGKSSLLCAIAGQVPRNPKAKLYGKVLINGEPCTSQLNLAFVRQEDLFFSQLTVRETLELSARLKLPSAMPLAEKVATVNEILRRLGLEKCADTPVGDAKTRGVSGGEKKRLNIGCELLGSPSLVLADEPTTGLDSFQAERVMGSLQSLAKDHKHTVVCVIHQPRASIVRMCDDLLILSEGNVIYSGPTNGLARHLSAVNYPCPRDENPVEYTIDLISVDSASPDHEQESRRRIKSLADAWSNRNKVLIPLSHAKSAVEIVEGRRARTSGPLTQFRLLLVRSWRQVNRSKFSNVTRAMTQLASALIFGGIFYKMGLGQSRIGDRVGLLQVAAVNTAMSTVVKTLTTFPKEKAILNKDRVTRTYGVLPYFSSKLLAELPSSAIFPNIFGLILYRMTGLLPAKSNLLKFMGVLTLEAFSSSALGMLVGAAVDNEDAALSLGPSLMTVAIIFSGFYASTIPAPLRWLKEVSLIRWAFEALCVNELKGMEFICDKSTMGPCMKNGDQMLERLTFENSSVASACRGMSKVLLGCYGLTYCMLLANSPKFQPMLDRE
jgi:ABC-type multidrug transport system ATPase subunit